MGLNMSKIHEILKGNIKTLFLRRRHVHTLSHSGVERQRMAMRGAEFNVHHQPCPVKGCSCDSLLACLSINFLSSGRAWSCNLSTRILEDTVQPRTQFKAVLEESSWS